jgi:hypothetical protein
MKGDVIQYRKGYKYSLWETYRVLTSLRGYEVRHHLFALDVDGWLTVFADYPWDGPSGPTIDTPSFMRGSLVHDVLYEMLRLGLLPHDPCFHLANLELHIICLEDGMWEWRAQYVFYAVEDFGNASAALRPEKIITAPKIKQLIRET